MKKAFYLMLMSLLLFVFVACDTTEGGGKGLIVGDETTTESQETTTVAQETTTAAVVNVTSVKSILEAEGYVFEQRDQSSIDYYTENAVNAKYSISVTITDLYVAYVNTSERWLELIAFSTTSQADEFVAAVDELDTTGLLVFQQGEVVVITYSEATITALNS